MLASVVLFVAGLGLGAVVGILFALLLASGAPRHPEGKTWQRT